MQLALKEQLIRDCCSADKQKNKKGSDILSMLQCFDAKPFYCSQFSFLSNTPISVLSSDNVVIRKKDSREKLISASVWDRKRVEGSESDYLALAGYIQVFENHFIFKINGCIFP